MDAAARVQTWIDERLNVSELLAPLREKTVPVHRYSQWYFLGGLTLFLFTVQLCSGVLLLLYYRPSANEAYESVQNITNHVEFGWLVRSVHSWSANLMVFCAFAHMFSVAFARAYRKPRELTWMTGMFLLFLVLGFGFSGYLLPWNTRAYFATKVGTEVAGQVPVVGHSIMVILRGGEDVSGATLTRFFALHVAVLPALAIGMVMLHLLLVQKFGTSVPVSVESEWEQNPDRRREMKFFPNFFLRELIGWYIALGFLIALAAFFPWELGTKADPFSPAPPGIKPEWYFLAQFQTLKLIPAKIFHMDGEVLGILGFGLGGALWLGLPFIEALLGPRGARYVRVGAVFVLTYLAGMSVVGYMAR
jgi:quinol-cytochrome oxidoreductase complex cytochrome b subunit